MFQYHPQIIAKFPQVVGGVIYATGVQNAPSSAALQAIYAAEQAAVKQRTTDAALSELPSLAAWRTTFSAFGVAPTKYRSAAEALLRRLTKKGDIPSINTLVDLGNIISIRYGIPVAMFDTRHLTGYLSVCFAKGHERYTELGSDELVHPEVGEVIFADESGLVFARRWCWKQSLQSAAQLDTTNVLIVSEAQHTDSREMMENAVADLLNLLQRFAGGQYQSTILAQDKPQFKVSDGR
jgi:DNA/RNA-binding domain of Phe-tRNA-synthetase-like protein